MTRVTAGPYSLDLRPNSRATLYMADGAGEDHEVPWGLDHLDALVQFAGEVVRLNAYADSAITAERERCAKLAESFGHIGYSGLAAAIRKGNNMKIGTLEHNLSMIRGTPNPANLSRESRRILNESLERPDRRQTTVAADFLTDATEIALAAFDDAYTAEYTTTGTTDNKAVAMRAAVESIVALCAMEAKWKPGDPRCDQCDNGILATWVACPYCGHRISENT